MGLISFRFLAILGLTLTLNACTSKVVAPTQISPAEVNTLKAEGVLTTEDEELIKSL